MTSASWRKVGARETSYPSWLRELADKSGVYAIRLVGLFSREVVYVGESHSGRLLKTITRHFQAWNRGNTFSWQGTDPGRTYDREACEVRVQVCAPSRAISLQNAWIKTLKPRDNILGAEDVVPF